MLTCCATASAGSAKEVRGLAARSRLVQSPQRKVCVCKVQPGLGWCWPTDQRHRKSGVAEPVINLSGRQWQCVLNASTKISAPPAQGRKKARYLWQRPTLPQLQASQKFLVHLMGQQANKACRVRIRMRHRSAHWIRVWIRVTATWSIAAPAESGCSEKEAGVDGNPCSASPNVRKSFYSQLSRTDWKACFNAAESARRRGTWNAVHRDRNARTRAINCRRRGQRATN